MIPRLFHCEGGSDVFLSRSILCKVSWLFAVEAIPGGWAILGCVVLELPPSMPSIPLSSAQINWNCYVVKGSGGI